MTLARQQTGRAAEDLTAARLEGLGWRIIERNARTRFGELDIVALDRRTLVFVEVKAGRAESRAGPERPVLAVGLQKQRRLRRLAGAWLADARAAGALASFRFAEIRFDAVGVTYDSAGQVADCEHIKAAF